MNSGNLICIMKKKVVSLLLAAAMTTAALAGCGSSNGSSSSDASTGADSTSATSASASTDGEKKDAAGEKIAMITDSGDITDESFNQITWETVCAYGDANGVEYEYYKPAEDTDEERINSIDLAVSEGATVVVMPGYLFGPAIAEEQDTYPDVTFIAVDVTEGDIVKNGKAVDLGKNVYICSFEEEQAGYLAGYAAVKDGYTSLGFLGGIAVPAVIRFGYGYVQGINAAAEEDGVDVNVKYYYGGQFYGDANITSRMEGWYSNGTQVVFACGGGIYTSAVEAALKNNGYVIGVDVDQNYIGANGVADGTYAYNPFITSAMKGLTEAVNTALADIDAGSWGDIAGSNGNFGLEDGDYIGLPTDADSWNFESFTTDEYEEVKGKIKSGEITVDNSSDDATKPTVSEFTTVNYIQ